MIRRLLSLTLIVVPACSSEQGDAFRLAFSSAERAFHAGRFQEAAGAYDRAVAAAIRPYDRDEATFLKARSFQRIEQWADARATLERLAQQSPAGERTGRATFELADLEISHGNAARGWVMLDLAATRFPGHGLARAAILQLVERARAVGGETAAATWLSTHAAAFRGTEQEDVLAFERARSLDLGGSTQQAHDAYLANVKKTAYPTSLTDDAYFRAAEIDEKLGRYDEAIRHLRQLLAHREPPGVLGANERPAFTKAQLRIAEIYRDRLGDHPAARREFEKLYQLHPTATKRPGALWAQARLAREDGDMVSACALMKRLADGFPESRYVPCAREVCPTATPSQHDCKPYLLRALHGEAGSDAATR